MRNLFHVLELIVKTAPKAHPVHAELLTLQKQMKKEAAYWAPECMTTYWNTLSVILNKHLLPPLREEWQIKIVSFFTTKTEAEVKAIK